jgi:ribosome-associated toxin RatA of RatAB toxin-antitoxin module
LVSRYVQTKNHGETVLAREPRMIGRRKTSSLGNVSSTTCLTGALALALVIAVSQSAVAATITVDAERRGDTIDIRASVVLKADAATAWRVLTDYDRYTEFLPDLRLSRVVARHGATVTVEQSGDAALWIFRMPLDITFEINEVPPISLQSRAVAGSLHALASSYSLTPTRRRTPDYAGTSRPGSLRLRADCGQHSVARQFQALARRSAASGRTDHA